MDKSNSSSHASRRQLTIILGITLAFAVFLLATIDEQEILRVLSEADWRPIPAALLFTLISYACVGYSFSVVGQVMGVRMSTRDLSEIGYVTASLNHVVTTGGVAGYSLRYVMMNEHGVLLKDVLAVSIVHYYLTSLDMLSMLPVGIAYLLLNSSVPRGVMITVSLMTLFFGLVAVIASLVVFIDSLRLAILRFAARTVDRLIKRDIQERLESFNESLSRGVRVIRRHPRTLLWIMLLTFTDWLSSVLVLYYCFDALGPPIRIGQAVSGFVIGIMAGVLSMVPSGYGVQEGSMAGVFKLMGVSYEQAVLASILFRVIYYLMPYFFSLLFYRRLLRNSEAEAH